MKVLGCCISLIFTLVFPGCEKENANQQQIIPIPNGDFEFWNNWPILDIWQTNSCPVCAVPYEAYIVKKVTDVSNGQFAAQFIFNGNYSSFAINRFFVSSHPEVLTGYIKSTISSGDTALIQIDLLSGNNIVGSGIFFETTSSVGYRKIEIPISQTSLVADSAVIRILGGKKSNTELFVDNLVLIRNN